MDTGTKKKRPLTHEKKIDEQREETLPKGNGVRFKGH